MNSSEVDPTVPGVPPSETGAGDQGELVIGSGGPCAGDLVPSYGYSCNVNGGPRGAGQHMHPSGLANLEQLPHAPYKNASGAVLHAWRPSHWFTVQYTVAQKVSLDVDRNDESITFPSDITIDEARTGSAVSSLDFERGGFQGAEGFSANAEWWIEGVEEELDVQVTITWLGLVIRCSAFASCRPTRIVLYCCN